MSTKQARVLQTTFSLAGAGLLVLAAAACAPEPGTTSTADGTLQWGSCDEFVKTNNEVAALIGTAPIDKNTAKRMSCATLDVPLDYGKPEGKTIPLAVSKLEAKGNPNGRVVFTNPGGPGLEGRTFPALIESSDMAALGEESTLVGIDVRGTGGSAFIDCAAPELDPSNMPERATLISTIEKSNAKCVDQDPAFFEQLTTQNAAKDLDALRSAMNLSKVDYFGVSWGTELGVEFMSSFPGSVDRVLLDSVSDIRQQSESSLFDVVEATLKFAPNEAAGGTPQEGTAEEDVVVEDDVVIEEDSETADTSMPEISDEALEMMSRFSGQSAKTALICNAYADAADQTLQQQFLQNRIATLGEQGGIRPQHPISLTSDVSICAGWPFAPAQISATKQAGPTLQIVAHASEIVTPLAWAEHAQQQLGGDLLVLKDGNHGSLASGPAATQGAEFLLTGTPMK